MDVLVVRVKSIFLINVAVELLEIIEVTQLKINSCLHSKANSVESSSSLNGVKRNHCPFSTNLLQVEEIFAELS